MSGGRPTLFTQELSDIICDKLANGQSMRSVCREESMPCMTSVFKWLRENELFAQQYARAKEESADALFEELLDIADDGTNDWMERNDPEGNCTGYQLNGEHVQRSRIRLDTRKWALSKLKPKKYGERISVGGDVDNPLTVLIKEISGDTLRPKDGSD